MELNSTEEIIEDLRQGKMVVIMDDEDRENEGDLLMAAELVTPQAINFMAKYGRGLICLTLTKERCQQLRLPLMVNENDQIQATNFTISIEAAEGVTTGISAADRATTIQAAVKADAMPQDIVQPGHIFPLMAQPGGVLVRAGHTEAGCDLARLAGLGPAAVIVEILNEDGTMARRPDLEVFAQQHDLKIGTIADLIHYRVRNEKTIERVSECQLPTEHGMFRLIAFQDCIDNEVHLAMVKGDIKANEPVLVRVHVQNTLCDLLSARRANCGWPLDAAIQQVAEAGEGVIVILRNHDSSREIVQRIEEAKWHDADKSASEKTQQGQRELRTYGVGAQILADLGVQKMKVMSAPTNMHGLAGFDLEVSEFIGLNKQD
ncbi:MAG: bifunctional 3,4-dihydroxy-2-butanone-4-phosphate synthase/GTP cyclohydrolase II [Chromatiales bacterium]|jgi:3,4-dihydroxy 2-butanone 4-phosphate synthase/GTP cyclohydrolase II